MLKGVDYRTLIARSSPLRCVQSFIIPSKKVRLTLAIVSIILVFTYSTKLLAWLHSATTNQPYWDQPFITKHDTQNFNYSSSYFVNTAGCKMPSLPILDKHIQKFLKKPAPLNCTPALIESDSNSIWFQLTENDIRKHYQIDDTSWIECCYQPFKRQSNNKIKNYGPKTCFKYGEHIEVAEEFIAVSCTHPTKTRQVFYRDYFAFVPLKPEVEERCESITLKARSSGDEEKLSVMILGIDSVSRLNFRRQMKLTAEMVIGKLKGVELLGYNKVGDNTYPNLVPALIGRDVDELSGVCHPYPNSPFDRCPFIWKDFSGAGYRTFYAEDSSGMETFNYQKRGFLRQPTDYYLRNFFREASSTIGYNKKMNSKLCLGGRNPTQILVEYTRKVLSVMKDRLSFSLLWACTMTHDYFEHPPLIDEYYRNLLEEMEQEGFLNKSVVILLSDHGIRYGKYRKTYQGMMEERQPFLYILLPTWFQHRYPSAFSNLQTNRRQLTSPFDLYETLKDLSKMPQISQSSIRQRSLELLESKSIPRGISLFLPIPPSRTCADAGIAPHWCTCHEHKSIATDDWRVIAVVRYAVDSLNQMLKKYRQCSALKLHSIDDASLGMLTEQIVSNKTKNQFSDITVRFQTRPGEAEFEATVRIDSFNRSSMTAPISRTNLYGHQSYCVEDYRMKLYCFCTRQ